MSAWITQADVDSALGSAAAAAAGGPDRLEASNQLKQWADKGVVCTDETIRLYLALRSLLKVPGPDGKKGKVTPALMTSWKSEKFVKSETKMEIYVVSKESKPDLPNQKVKIEGKTVKIATYIIEHDKIKDLPGNFSDEKFWLVDGVVPRTARGAGVATHCSSMGSNATNDGGASWALPAPSPSRGSAEEAPRATEKARSPAGHDAQSAFGQSLLEATSAGQSLRTILVQLVNKWNESFRAGRYSSADHTNDRFAQFWLRKFVRMIKNMDEESRKQAAIRDFVKHVIKEVLEKGTRDHLGSAVLQLEAIRDNVDKLGFFPTLGKAILAMAKEDTLLNPPDFDEIVAPESMGFSKWVDFVYVPIKRTETLGVGYAFLNLTSPERAEEFMLAFEGFDGWASSFSKTACSMRWSNCQGLSENVSRYRNSPMMSEEVPAFYKPVLLRDGVRIPFPRPTKALPRRRKVKGQEGQS
mmetsp:Transcript_22741/g.60847  ORF Transcript_22741/g.60847 Transcript_22741/m.60847 type:complete len:470 (-) Transcript_22741:314-1723(-)